MKSFLGSTLLFLLLSISSSSISIATFEIKTPSLSVPNETIIPDPKDNVFKTIYNYTQTLDHFNYRPESNTTFNQSYMINTKYWGTTGNAPILVYLGAESPLYFNTTRFLTDMAQSFEAVLLLYIEHRYYGQSMPFGNSDEAYKNASTRGYFNSAQALADYAAIIMHVKKEFNAEKSPVIVVGGSYGGMLASWMRLKYPHVVLGALASSAPVLYFEDLTPHDTYYSIVAKDYWDTSKSCHETIKLSWLEIEQVGSNAVGLSNLSQKFNTCSPLTKPSDLSSALFLTYSYAAQYDNPVCKPYNHCSPVSKICAGIDDPSGGDDILSRIHAGIVAYKGDVCYPTNSGTTNSDTTKDSCIIGTSGWQWQKCSEMVMPIGHGNVSMFPSAPFNLARFIENCQFYCGVRPRPHWVTTYYGGHDIKLILERFASNIIFSNGLRDPYSGGGVLKDISDSIVALTTNNGSHCLDILAATPNDPDWLVEQRENEIKIIKEWIDTYYEDLADTRRGGPRLSSASHGPPMSWDVI